MRNLLFIRHAQSEYNVKLTSNLDSCLTDIGKEQAQKLANFLKDNVDLSNFQNFVSPYLRCLQTAEVISKNCGINFEVIEDCRKIITYNQVVILDRSEEFSQFKWIDSFPKTYFQENMDEFMFRMKNFLTKLPKEGNFLVLSHGTPVEVLSQLECGICKEPATYEAIKNASITWTLNGNCIWFNKEC